MIAERGSALITCAKLKCFHPLNERLQELLRLSNLGNTFFLGGISPLHLSRSNPGIDHWHVEPSAIDVQTLGPDRLTLLGEEPVSEELPCVGMRCLVEDDENLAT